LTEKTAPQQGGFFFYGMSFLSEWKMYSLFPEELPYPKGFFYLPDFISEKEEQDLLQVISQIALQTFTYQGFEAKRRTASFGYDYSFTTGQLQKGKAIPDAFHPLLTKVADHLHLTTAAFQELLVTEYPPGSVINWHRDAPPFALIAGISLNADCTFRLRPFDKAKQKRSAIISVPLLRRSLYIMQHEARSDWQHSIAPVKEPRYSITLRTLK